MFQKNLLRKIIDKPWGVYFLIISTIFVVYISTVSYSIVSLDDAALVKDHYIFNKDLKNAPLAFSQNIFIDSAFTSFYRPLLRLSFMFDAQFGEKNIYFMSHLTNIVLHMIAMCLLYVFLRRLNIEKMTAFVFTLFFAVHPLATQTVSLIVGRNDSLLTIFVLGSFIYLIDTLREKSVKKYLLHILFLLFALFTKETAVMLPFVFGVYLLTFVGWRTLWEERKKYVYILIGWITTYFIYFKSRQAVLDSFTSTRYDFIDMLASIYQNSSSLISTVGKIFLPFNLSVFPVLTDMTLVYGVFSIIVLCVYIIFSKEKNYKLILFGLSWFILFIVLTLIKPLGMFQNFSENRIYLPMLGFIFIILGIGKIEFLSKVFQKKNIRILVISLLILTFSTITIIRNTYYKDGLSFWKNAVDTSPNNAPAFNNLGGMYYAQQDYTQAEYYYLEALKLNPTEKLAHYNLGLVYENQGKSSLAIEHYKQEIELGPRLKAVYIRLGELYVKEGKIKEAENYWKNMYESHPDRLGALYNLINLNFYHKKNISQTIFYAKQAKVKGLELPPEVFDLLNK